MKIILKFFLVAMIASVSVLSAQANQLTLYDGTATNEYSPIFGYFYDTPGYIVQTILPEADLVQMKYTCITSMKFYNMGDNQLNGGKLAVSLGTTNQTIFSNNSSPLAVTQVAEVILAAGGSETEIIFSEPFFYTGGNLVIETRVVEKGNYCHQFFLGKTSNEINVLLWSVYNTFVTAFYPKTTFEYDLMEYKAIINVEEIPFHLFYLGDDALMRSIRITNHGSNAFTPVFSGLEAPFSVEAVGEISSRETKDIVVSFAPDALGEYAQTLTIDCGAAGLFHVPVTGCCVETPDEANIVIGSATNALVPVDAQNYDHVVGGDICQMIYPKVMLSSLVGKKITGIKFYTENPMIMDGGNIQLSMTVNPYALNFGAGEVNYYYIVSNVVANSAPVAGETELVFTFNAPFEYNGGSLILQTQVTAEGESGPSDKFLGSIRGWSSLVAHHQYSDFYTYEVFDFLPKATFVYLNGDTPDLVMRGDVDGDGRVNMFDLTALIHFLLGDTFSYINYVNTAIIDSVDSEVINMNDLAALINYLLTNHW